MEAATNGSHGPIEHKDAFIIQNILQCLGVEKAESYDAALALVKKELAFQYTQPENEKVEAIAGVSVHEEERHYLKVVPEGVDPIEVQLKDTVLRCTWTKFECWSPGSTMSYGRDGEPHYSMIESTSEAAARKLYKLVQDEKVRAELAAYGWSNLDVWNWLRSQKISFDVHHSQW